MNVGMYSLTLEKTVSNSEDNQDTELYIHQ